MLNYQEMVRPGDHMVLLYYNENDVVKPVSEFITASLDRGERCIYVSGDTNMGMLKKVLSEYYDLEKIINKGDLIIIDRDEAYSKNGEFEPDKMIELLTDLTKDSLDLGYRGMSITGELSWLLDYGDKLDKIIEYEWKLNERVFVNEELTALCRYNLTKFKDDMLINIIQLHPLVVYEDKIHKNPYYLPPEGYKENNLSKYQLITWLKNIDEFTSTKSKFDKEIKRIENESIAKSEFMSKISHDMKTPLSAIISLAEFGMDENEDLKGIEYFYEIRNSAEYLLSLMNDILDYQKLKNNRVDICKTDVEIHSMLINIKNMMSIPADKKKVSLKVDFDSINEKTIYSTDSKKVSQVLINILSNAIKYTEPGGFVEWYSTILKTDEGYCLFNRINDTGVGMSKKFQRHMFESFAQEENILTQSEGGTGLGLPIVKQIVELMNGKLKIESELKIGTSVEIYIPIFETNGIANAINVPNLKGKKVLICEDIGINIKILIKNLIETEAEIDAVQNGIEAVAKVREKNYDLVLMDLRMPLMNGLEATDEIRKINTEIPIIIISADANEIVYKNADAYLTKPIDKSILFKTINQLIK